MRTIKLLCFKIMNKIEYFTKFVALSLLISASVLIVVKAIGIPDAYQIMGAYLRVDGDSLSLLLWFSALLVLEAIFIACRIYLGYCLYNDKSLPAWKFYLITILIALSGFYLTGLTLAILAVGLRLRNNLNAAKT